MAKSTFKRNKDERGAGGCVTIAFVHHKGGTGKTTSCLNIAGWLARYKKKVLVVDLDPQGNATAGLGIERKSLDDSIYDVFFGHKPEGHGLASDSQSQRHIEEIILETDSGIYLAPSSIDLLAAETHLAGQINNTMLLAEKLGDLKDDFDYILIDVPPGSTLLMINGIVASQNLIIPLDSGIFAYETMETLKTLILDLHEELGVEVNVMMFLLREYATTLFDRGITGDVRKLLKGFLKENITSRVKIYSIPFSRKIYKAQMKGKPISHYAPFSDVGRAYKRIAKEILKEEV